MDTVLRVEFSRLETTETPQGKKLSEKKYDSPTFATPRPVSKCKLASLKGSGTTKKSLDFEQETKALVQRQSQTLRSLLGNGRYKVKKVIKDRHRPKHLKADKTKPATTSPSPPKEDMRTLSPMDLD